LDVVLADTPAPPHLRVKVFNHVLGKSDTAFFASKAQATALKRRFPQCLHGSKMVLPTPNAALRRDLDTWFETLGIKPQVIGEFEDPALMKVIGADCGAIFPAPLAIAEDVRRIYDVALLGRTADVEERYYALSAERRLTHPGVLAITSAAQDRLFK
jgi:LysR family transcriptional regulator, transcriptional activator of nhaA